MRVCLILKNYNVQIAMKQKQAQGHREQTSGCQGEGVGKGRIGSLGLADANCYIWFAHSEKSLMGVQL